MSIIQLRTPIPGPKSKALSERRAKAVPRGLSHGTPIYVAKAEDAWLEDVDGNRYLDFAGSDQQDTSIQGWLRAFSERGLPSSVRLLLPLFVLAAISVMRVVLRTPSGRHIQARGCQRRGCGNHC